MIFFFFLFFFVGISNLMVRSSKFGRLKFFGKSQFRNLSSHSPGIKKGLGRTRRVAVAVRLKNISIYISSDEW